MESLERLKSLHQDLTAFTNTRLVNIDRLWQELETSVQDFRQLLDTPTQDNIKTDTLGSGKIFIDGDEYAVGSELIELSRAVGTALGLDEQESLRAILETQGPGVHLDPSLVRDVVTKFQDRRDILLQDCRIVFKEAVDRVEDDTLQERFLSLVQEVLEVKNGPRNNGSLFARKCFQAMTDIEKRQHKIGEAIGGRANLQGPQTPELYDLWEYQKASLFKQHEALAAVVTYLFKGNFTTSEDLRTLINIPKAWTRLDFHLVHYLPAFSAAFRQYGSPDHSSSKNDAQAINDRLAQRDLTGDRTVLQPFYAVLSLWWVVEYSGWFRDPAGTAGLDAGMRFVKSALEDHALEFLLSLCTCMNFDPWQHPARHEIIGLLLSETSGLTLEDEPTSDFFSALFMECLETFAESWITNMPDSIRQLKTEEDDMRLNQMTALQNGIQLNGSEDTTGQLHLECLLVLMSFAFEGRPLAAEELFWQDPEGNLFGFVQWASKRQTVPRVGAFCEMLCAISEGPVCAAAAHKFLLEESNANTSSRARRNPSMNYAQMFAELALYSRKVHERPISTQLPHLRTVLATDMNELESPVMLSCYLRLITHMCSQTALTRELIFSSGSADLIPNLLVLSSGPIPGYLRGSIFQTLGALLTDKTSEIGFFLWRTIDTWAASGKTSFTSANVKSEQAVPPSTRVLQNTLASIADSYEQSDAFLVLLCGLMASSPDDPTDGPVLQFPPDLGATYRPAGISPYVDFVIGQVFIKRVSELTDAAQSRTLLLHSLDFIVACLSSFNETYVALGDRPSSKINSPSSLGPISATTYAQIHPFARTMKWLFGSDASKALLAALHQRVDETTALQVQSAVALGLERCMDVVNIILDTQPTYIDIVRPLVTELERDSICPPSAIAAFEETISARPEIIQDLCIYAASDEYALVFRALILLDSLSRSKKLNSFFIQRGHSGTQMNRVVDMLGPNSDADLAPVCVALVSHLECDMRELEEGSDSPGYAIKDTILSFFNRCLASKDDLPNVAHLILGFARIGQSLDIAPDSMLESGTAVFNAILTLALVYPIGDQISDTWSWLLHIKAACIKVLQKLWSSKISTSIAVSQLRKFSFLAGQFGGLVVVNRTTLWDGLTVSDPSFWLGSSAEGLFEFLEHRHMLYDYAATEIRDLSASNLTSLQRNWLSTLLGRSTGLEGVQVSHVSIYDLFDFLGLDITLDLPMPSLKYFTAVQLDMYMSEPTEELRSLYDIDSIREVLRHHMSTLLGSTQSRPPADDDAEIENEAEYVLRVLLAKNRHTKVLQARRNALHNLIEVLVLALGRCPMDPTSKVQFILQMLQIILPKLDSFVLKDLEDSVELARACDALLFSLIQIPPIELQGRVENSIADRLFQLFRISVEGINMADSSPALRTIFYSICSQYLTRIVDASESNRQARRNSLDCIKSAGMRFINTLSDDAEDGPDTSKPAALNILGLLISLARSEKSPYLIDSLARANALELLIDPIKLVGFEFQEAVPVARKYLLTVLEARMLLLLQISRTREGAGALLDAGLMQAIRDSMIFSADPDLGMDVESAGALHNYYELVASILRVLVSTFLSRGLQNEQCQFLMRSFLQDYRPSMVGLFKRFTGVNGKAAAKSQVLLKEIVNAYVALTAMSGFVEFEEEDSGGLGTGRTMNGFT